MYFSPSIGIWLRRHLCIVTLTWVVAPVSIHQVSQGTKGKLTFEETKLKSWPFLLYRAAYLEQTFLRWLAFLQKKEIGPIFCFFYSLCWDVPWLAVSLSVFLFFFRLGVWPLEEVAKWELYKLTCCNLSSSWTHWAISSFKVHFSFWVLL